MCRVGQGSKHVTTGKQGFHFSAVESLLITADVPTVSQITRASIAAPYYSLVLELDPAVIAELVAEMDTALVADLAPIRVDPTDVEVADSAMRSEEHTSELQSLMRISYAVFCLKKKIITYKLFTTIIVNYILCH